MAGTLSKTRFSIYATNRKLRKRIVRELKPTGRGGGDYYTILNSRINQCESGKGGLTIFDLPDSMNTAPYRNPRLRGQKADLVNAANKYLSVRGKYRVEQTIVQPKKYTKRGQFKLAIGPEVVWQGSDTQYYVSFYLGKLDSTRLTQRKAEFMCTLMGMNIEDPTACSFLVIDLETGNYFEYADYEGSVLLPTVNTICDEINENLA